MPDGGCITLETSNQTLDAPRPVHDGAIARGDYVVVSVADTGTGMSRDVIAKAFEPFFTTKPIGQGTGLGLSMIYGFVRQSGGYVNVESDIGRGTHVQIYLPRSQAPDKQTLSSASASVTRGCGEVILVVEDDNSVRFTVTMLLRELGYSYIEAPDASVAIPYLQSNRRIDLLVTDVGLPNMNTLDAGMKMLAKPFTVEVLAAKIQRCSSSDGLKRTSAPGPKLTFVAMRSMSASDAKLTSAGIPLVGRRDLADVFVLHNWFLRSVIDRAVSGHEGIDDRGQCGQHQCPHEIVAAG